ncbi:CDP-diacylglycerol--glycerol-3-phosphate 3-phosphatidyltransferase [Candidatus Endowatersipora endosymbiont of Watersipora subatra]|uniref:CDP-diacylglycerol--glycerol-3-phosphate 3-phosphatidyltransferase n=1 Tax=Candidatus Endowatersipora endosymbiont of Watersipora subatra TaxID=3077946 RepID=UPI00312CAE99
MREISPQKQHAGPWSIPNLLTYARIAIVPAVVLCFDLSERMNSSDIERWYALALFVFASISDFLDGFLARVWKQTSSLGRILDPIADKLLISVSLLLLAADGTIAGFSIWAAVVILSREILVSGLREFLADIKVGIPATQLAKWKTTLQMIAIGFLIVGPAGDKILPRSTDIGLALLWISAIVTLYSGYDYFSSGLKQIIGE